MSNGFTIRFGGNDDDIKLALNKMALNEQSSKGRIIRLALTEYLIKHEYLNEKGNYETN